MTVNISQDTNNSPADMGLDGRRAGISFINAR